MRRAFKLQMYAGGPNHGVDSDGYFEEEARALDCVAVRIADMLRLREPAGSCSIRHSRTEFSCYIGDNGTMSRVVRPRRNSALLWSGLETRKWCEDVIRLYRDVRAYDVDSDSPPRGHVGNHPPRPVEETRVPKMASRFKPINRGS